MIRLKLSGDNFLPIRNIGINWKEKSEDPSAHSQAHPKGVREVSVWRDKLIIASQTLPDEFSPAPTYALTSIKIKSNEIEF